MQPVKSLNIAQIVTLQKNRNECTASTMNTLNIGTNFRNWS